MNTGEHPVERETESDDTRIRKLQRRMALHDEELREIAARMTRQEQSLKSLTTTMAGYIRSVESDYRKVLEEMLCKIDGQPMWENARHDPGSGGEGRPKSDPRGEDAEEIESVIRKLAGLNFKAEEMARGR